MKFRSIMAAALLCAALAVPAAGLTLEVDGQDCTEKARAVLVEDTTYVSLRAASAMLDPAAQVSWQSGTATVAAGGVTLTARPGDGYILVDGAPVYVENGVRLENGAVLVPLRALCAALGGSVRWDGARRAAVVRTADAGGETMEAEREDASGAAAEQSWSDEDLYWLSRIISAESQGEPLAGKLAVGTVVLNRVESREFPDTIREVIFDMRWGGQFEPVRNGTVYNEPTEESVLAARMCLQGAREAGESLYFLAPDLTSNHWVMQNRTYVTTIGCHWFYK